MSSALALRHLDGWNERFGAARMVFEDLCERLDAIEGLRVVRLRYGAQAVQLSIENASAESLRGELRLAGIEVPEAEASSFTLRFNESLALRSAEELASSFERALAASLR
jgi:hypothetical protein